MPIPRKQNAKAMKPDRMQMSTSIRNLTIANARHLKAHEVMYLLKVAGRLNANLLMNIGPRADGSIDPADKKALQEVGVRIRENGIPSQEDEGGFPQLQG
jgi:alpha-L-fucosidase